MKFRTLDEIEDHFTNLLKDRNDIAFSGVGLNHNGTEGTVFGYRIKDGCDIVLGEFVKRWKSYYI